MSNNLKQQFQNFIAKANEGNIDFLEGIVHSEISMLTIDISSGNLVEVKGKKPVIQAFISSLAPPNDLVYEVDKILCDDNEICTLGYFKGTIMQTSFGLIKINEPFRIRVTIFVEFEKSILKRIEYYYDTFEVMRLCGTALLQQDNKEKIKNYLSSLINLGIITKDNIIN